MKRELLLDIYQAGLAAVDPYHAVTRALRCENHMLQAAGTMYSLNSFDRVLVVGSGKATARMASAAEDILGDRIRDGAIVVKHGHTAPLRFIAQAEAGHPIPDPAGIEGTRRVLDLVRQADEKTLVLCLLSGGSSALLVSPADGVTLEDKQRTTDLFLKAGASIEELNILRKHISAVKGGRLARAAVPATVVSLILSDVVGDRLDVIASGPTAPDGSTFSDAVRVIKKYKLQRSLPKAVTGYIERGGAGLEPETAKSGDVCFQRTRNVVIGSIAQALFAARNKARTAGYVSELISAELQGEAREVARELARTAIGIREGLRPGEQRCLLFGGESTVTVHGNGSGGRNQELALAFATQIAGIPGISLLSAGTDGTDGPTDAAGAVVDGATAIKARNSGIHPENYLGNNDSYTFFTKLDALNGNSHHVRTGPTGTNVMDMQIILLEG